MSWYCSGNGSYLDSILGCPSGILTAAEQATAMRGNFGNSSDPALVNQSVSSFSSWLQTTGYDSQIASLTGTTNWMTYGLIGIGVIGVVVLLGDSGSRRYGR